MDRFAPERGAGEDVGLINAREMPAARGGTAKRVERDALDLFRGINLRVGRSFAAVGASGLPRAEINSSGEFADDFQIYGRRVFQAQRRNIFQRLDQTDGTHVDVKP